MPYEILHYGVGVIIGGLIITVSHYRSKSYKYKSILDKIVADKTTVVSESIAKLLKF